MDMLHAAAVDADDRDLQLVVSVSFLGFGRG